MPESTDIIDYIKKTPKTELHLHIEGTLEPEHMFELAKKNNISIPYKNIQEVKSAYNFHNLDSFLIFLTLKPKLDSIFFNCPISLSFNISKIAGIIG